MEKAILKTLIYADIFDYPLNIYEIHKWLIGSKINLRQVESALGGLSKKLKRGSSAKIKSKHGYFFLPRREQLVGKRIRRHKQSLVYIRKITVFGNLLKIIPWVKLVGVSGGLAMENADKDDDIDLFIITSYKRIWLSRLLILAILSVLGQRRKPDDSIRRVAGKICCNILVDEENLAQARHDIYTAHEVLQMKVLWERDGVYSRYLADNDWAFKFLPNWVGVQNQNVNIKYKNDILKIKRFKKFYILLCHFTFYTLIFNFMESLAKKLQLQIMQVPRGMERIHEGALYFHPNDVRPKILEIYKKRISKT